MDGRDNSPAMTEPVGGHANGRSYFGYRLHVGTDQSFNLIRKVALTPAHVVESLVAEALISGDERRSTPTRATKRKRAGRA
jgi:hypothetical protein